MAHAAAQLLAVTITAVATAATHADAADGFVRVDGSRAAISLEARDAPFSAVRDALAGFRLSLSAAIPDDRPVTVSFAALPPHEAVARLGAALGGLSPLHVTWQAGAGRSLSHSFLVRGATPERRALEAYCLPDGGLARAQLLGRLDGFGVGLLPELEDFFSSTTEERARANAVVLLGRIEAPGVTPALVGHLRGDQAPLVREAAAVALGGARRAEGHEALRAALADPDPGVALAAAWSLVRLGDGEGVPLAISRIADPEPALALRAIDVVEEAADPEHLAALEAAAATAPAALVRGRARAATEVVRSAGRPGGERAAGLEPLLADPVLEVRHFARAALAKLTEREALEALDRAAADPSSPGRAEAAQAAAALRLRAAGAARAPVIE